MRIDRKTRKNLFKIKKLRMKLDELHLILMQKYDEKIQSEYNVITTKIYYIKKQIAKSISDSVSNNSEGS
jgi:hypothetical protein